MMVPLKVRRSTMAAQRRGEADAAPDDGGSVAGRGCRGPPPGGVEGKLVDWGFGGLQACALEAEW